MTGGASTRGILTGSVFLTYRGFVGLSSPGIGLGLAGVTDSEEPAPFVPLSGEAAGEGDEVWAKMHAVESSKNINAAGNIRIFMINLIISKVGPHVRWRICSGIQKQ